MKKLILIIITVMILGCSTTQPITYNLYFQPENDIPDKIIIEHIVQEQELNGLDIYNMSVPWAILGATLLFF